jgi:hypothetical protein
MKEMPRVQTGYGLMRSIRKDIGGACYSGVFSSPYMSDISYFFAYHGGLNPASKK